MHMRTIPPTQANEHFLRGRIRGEVYGSTRDSADQGNAQAGVKASRSFCAHDIGDDGLQRASGAGRGGGLYACANDVEGICEQG